MRSYSVKARKVHNPIPYKGTYMHTYMDSEKNLEPGITLIHTWKQAFETKISMLTVPCTCTTFIMERKKNTYRNVL